VAYAFDEAVDWTDVAWSPDDDRLVCFCSVEDRHEGFVLDPDGGEPERLGEDELPWHWLPYYGLWQGEWAAIEPAPPAQAGRLVYIEPCEGVVPWQFCIRDHVSGEVMQLTYDLDFAEPGGIDWSPDGNQIVFNAGSGPNTEGHYTHKLYVINADGSDLRQITEGETTDLDPSWSTDGEWIAFQRDCGLWLVHPDGSDAHNLLEGSGEFCPGSLTWSPDSQRIAFLNWQAGEGIHEIWVVGRDGSDPYEVYAFERMVDWIIVAWGPSDSQLACLYGGEGWGEGFVLNPDGGEPEWLGEDELPWHWLPNYWLREG
jgi:hypothetical protein